MIENHHMTHNGIDFVTVHGAALDFGVRSETVRSWIASGRLTAFRPVGRKIWLRVDDVHAAKDAAASAAGGRGKALSQRELDIMLDKSITVREASILTGRSAPAVHRARKYHGGAA